MKNYPLLFLIVAFTLFLNACKTNQSLTKKDAFASIKKPYLGQKPPGSTPQPFAPDMVCTKHYEYSGMFTPDMKEFYFIRRGGKYKKSTFIVYQYKNNEWRDSVVSRWLGQPTFSSDGKTMFLGARYKERTKAGWSKLKSLDAPFKVKKTQYVMRLSSAANGTRYFDTYDENDESFPLRYSRLVNGKYEEPKALSKSINTGIQLSHPFIAPDESYLLWDAQRKEGYGDSDIYISFRQKDGSWGKAINLGDKINTKAWEAAPTVTPDGKYLFFNRQVGTKEKPNVQIYWVDAQIIEKLRPKE